MSLMSWEQAVQWLRDQPDQQELVRACYFDDPLVEAAERFWKSAEWKAIAALLPPPQGKALDLGAGRGISSYAMARDGWQVTALEPDPSQLVGASAIRSLAEQSGMKITVVSEYSEKLPFADNSFDAVNCRQVLHHARDLPQTCREIFRVLKPGGMMVATREHVISRPEDLPVFLDAHPLHKLYGGEHAYLLNEYLAAISNSGLVLEKVLNPYQSDINLFPETKAGLKKSLADRFHCPSILIPDFILARLGARSNTPGRLYSFVARKNG